MQQPAAAASNHRGEIFGLTAILIVTFLKIHAVNIIDDKIVASFLLRRRWRVGRWWYCSTAIMIVVTRPCDCSPRTLKLWHLGVTTLFTLTLATYLLGRTALWIGLALSLLALLSRAMLHRRHAVLTIDNLGAVTDLGEALIFVLVAVL